MAEREIWFVSDEGGGSYRPANRAGCRAFVLVGLWVVLCGTAFPIIALLTMDWRWLVAMFVVGGAGLLVFARTVRRHS